MQLPVGLVGVTFDAPTAVATAAARIKTAVVVSPAAMAFSYNPVTGMVTFTGLPGTLSAGASLSMAYRFTTPNLSHFQVSSSISTTTKESSSINNAEAASAIILQAVHAVTLSKQANADNVTVGQFVRYTIVVRNIGNLPANGLQIVDSPAPGLEIVAGSLTVDDADHAGILIPGNPIRITGIDVPVGGTATVTYLMRVGAATVNGELINTAQAFLNGTPVSAVASAHIHTGSDPVFDQSRILGKVFEDLNSNGWQDPGERGIPGVRLETVEGLVSETDSEGRYHFEGLTLSNSERGQNFIVKVDPATLPEGQRLHHRKSTDPSRDAGALPVRFDFGVKLPVQTNTDDGAKR